MDRQPTLIGALVRLRPLVETDRAALYVVASDPLIWEQHPAHDRWRPDVFAAFFDDALAKGGALAVEDAATGALIGSSRFQNHDPADGGSVEIGWTFLARSHWRCGVNRDMKRLMLDYALASVARVLFTVGEGNARSIRALEAIGARWTGEVEDRPMADGITRHLRYFIER
ncbi:N-acetyltransferase [Croceicoccus ponticola]|uniref:N-acetyltransferase n=1 Tax=Croceicoccus ponticola TaxID=2217664 RepID=A0A437GYT9_9SPHN|nr:GNAT family N-acetyltransferase [Croceicoccus ponticola]RVQ67819.1 N-acetyltransferase [Croceicoccus ponticola]